MVADWFVVEIVSLIAKMDKITHLSVSIVYNVLISEPAEPGVVVCVYCTLGGVVNERWPHMASS